MNKYVTILCYKSKYGIPAFERTGIFEARGYDNACSIGSATLEKMFPEEIKNGYNDWTICIDDLVREARIFDEKSNESEEAMF